MKRQCRQLTIVHNETIVNSVTEYCYLGNVIGQHLSLTTNFDRSYKKAATRLRLLNCVRRHLITKASESIYELMVLPLVTYSSAIKRTYNRTQLTKLDSLERRASTIIGGATSVKSTRTVVEKQICTLIKRCPKKEIGHDVFDNYFTVLGHGKITRNNNRLLKLPMIKLEASRPSFYFGAAKIFNDFRYLRKRIFKINIYYHILTFYFY